MIIKVINFLDGDTKMHLKADAELGAAVNHLKQKFKDVKIHSIHPEEGPIIIFKPPAAAEEFEGEDFSWFGLFCVICIVIIIICQS